MKRYKTMVLMAGAFVAFFGLTLQAWGGGTPAPGLPPSCQVANPGQGAIALRGTAALEVHEIDGLSNAHDVDLTLRLERGGAIASFRSNDPDTNIWGVSNADIACLFLEKPAFAQSILAAFAPTKTRLVITSKSISNAEQGLIPGTGSISTVADITIYAQ